MFETNDSYNSLDAACKARLDLFNLPSVNKYKKILYLDTDIIITGDLTPIFTLPRADILYVLREDTIDDVHHGSVLFGHEVNNYHDRSAFTSGILLFNNCLTIKWLFDTIKADIVNRPHFFSCYDQPYIIYSAFKYKLFDNTTLLPYAVNNDMNIHSGKIIHHFPFGPGQYQYKMDCMNGFLGNLNNHTQSIICSKLQNRKFTWKSSTIVFLDKFKLEAFGSGVYRRLGKRKIVATFGGRFGGRVGGRNHFIQFNNEYTQFVSIREDDSEHVIGNLCN